MDEDLPKGSFNNLVLDKILVDAFKPKFGDIKDLAVFSFFVKQRDAADKLMTFILQKNFDLLDIEVSPDPKEHGQYILFVEMNRNKDMFATMDKLLLHIDHLVSIKQWRFRTSAYKEYVDWDRENFIKVVPQTPNEYSNKKPISGKQDEINHASQNLKDADANHLPLEELIEKQVVKFNQSHIQSLKEQIKTINEDKFQIFRHIEDLKADREHLYKQLELYHDREKLALIREQQDFKRIRSLENQLTLLEAPVSGEMKIVTSDKSAYDTDIKPVKGLGVAEKEDKDIKEISVATQDEYKKTSEGNQDPDEASAFSESSDFINKENHDYPDVDEIIEKPAKQTDHRDFIDTEKETIEETNNKKTNWPRDPLVSKEDEETPEPETTLKMQDLKHIEPDGSDDSAATSRLDDIIAQSESEESTAKVDDDSFNADDPVPKYMLLGREALKKEDFDNAIKYFLKVVDILPTSGAVVLNLADLYFLKKDYETARKYAALALELGEKPAASVLEKINEVIAPDLILQPLEKDGEAITPESDDYVDYDRPRAKEADSEPEPEQDKADDLENTVFIELNALNEALSSKEHTTPSPKEDDEKTAQKKDEARRYMAFGVEAAKHKHYHEAIEHFSESVEFFPNNSAGFCDLAVLNYRLKEYETAQRYAERAIDLGSPSANQILKKIKAVMADNKKSSQNAKKNKSKNFFIESDDDTLAEFMKKEKENQSDLAVDASLREKDTVVNDHFKRGLAAFEKKNFHKAIGHFNKVVKLLPNGVPSYIHLTKIHYHLGEYSQARKHAKKAFHLGDHTLKPIIDKIDARLAKESTELKEQETTAKAIKDTVTKSEVIEPQADVESDKKAVQDEPKPQKMVEKPDIKFIESTASIEAADSRQNTAPVSMEKDVAKDINEKTNQNNDVKKFMALGVEAAGKKDHLKAVEHFNKVIEILPDSAVGFFNLAILYYHLENYNMASKHAEKALNLGLHSAQSILEKSKLKMVTDSKAPPAKKKEMTPAKKAPIQTDENKPDHINKTQLALPFEEPKETIAHGKTVLKQAEDLTKQVGKEQPTDRDERASETVPPAESPQIESPQVPSESGSASEYFELGMAASERNDFNIALEYFNKVATVLPQVPSSFLNMADLHYRMKNYKTARKHAQRALELGAHSAHRILDKIENSLEVQTA